MIWDVLIKFSRARKHIKDKKKFVKIDLLVTKICQKPVTDWLNMVKSRFFWPKMA